MSKKDEALKKCLRVLNPIANENVYETQWIDSAIHAAYEALEEKEWQGLTENELCNALFLQKPISTEIAIIYHAIEKKLKEKNHGTT